MRCFPVLARGVKFPIQPYPRRASPAIPAPAMRVRVDNAVIAYEDLLQGRIEQHLAREVGDFIVRRADGLFAYQLAVVVDDFEQSITDVVRGADLLASTARQILLQRLLGLPTPRYMHLPVAMNQTGEKLSKQTRAAPLAVSEAPGRLWQALRFLGQEPPAELAAASIPEIWSWALANWRTERIPTRRSIREGDAG